MARKSSLSIVYPDAAGVDVGGLSHWVAVPPERDVQPVREFGAVTASLHALADWLQACGIRIVAMESTGVYWIALYEILEARGLTVLLVNARDVRRVPGRKTDVLDCQWLRDLLVHGLLSGAHRPHESIVSVREIVRVRQTLVRDQGIHLQRMGKALTQMNLRLDGVLSDIAGQSGLAMIRAIVAGERDPQVLARLCNYRVRASTDQVVEALSGHFRVEHLFALRQALHFYDATQRALAECDQQIQALLAKLARYPGLTPSKVKRTTTRNAAHFNLQEALMRLAGVDLTQIPGVHDLTALSVLTEIGPDLSRFASDKHFVSYLNLAPNPRISGGKRLPNRPRHTAQRAAQALKLAAWNLRRSPTYLGACYRRMSARLGKPAAIKAVAAKIARIIYKMLKQRASFIELGEQYFEQRYKDRLINNLKRRAARMGFALVEQPPPIPHAAQTA